MKLLALIGCTVSLGFAAAPASALPWRPPLCRHHECPIEKPPGGRETSPSLETVGFLGQPTITGLTNPAAGTIHVTWAPSLGGTARIKRDCQYTCGYGKVYYVRDTGAATLAGQPAGLHYFRVCQAFCSRPVAIVIQ